MLDGIAALLVVNGGFGVNALNADDSGSTANKSGTLTSSTITGLGMADGITYANIAALTIALGTGGENFTIASTDTGSTPCKTATAPTSSPCKPRAASPPSAAGRQ